MIPEENDMSKQRTRLTDVAQLAGVSTATVSRVVNRTGPVSPETRHLVLTAIDTLGYDRPTSDHNDALPLIGIITPELTNPIFAIYAHALQKEVTQAGALPLIATQTPGATSESDYVTTLMDKGARGLIFVSGRHADDRADLDRYHKLTAKNIPFVTINGARPEIMAPDYSTGDAMGIEAALHHLHDLGHERIALLSGKSHIIPARRKIDAYRKTMQQILPKVTPMVYETFYTYEAAAAVTHDILTQGATAIITASDVQALGTIRTVRSLGMRVPDDISVVGFDDAQLMEHLDPALTTVRQPVNQICSAAVQSLFSQIATDHPVTGSFVYTPDLIVRSSTGRAKHR